MKPRAPSLPILCLAFCAAGGTGCGAGVPVELVLDEISFELSIDDAVDELSEQLRGSGLLPPGTQALPERWPAELPDACFEMVLATDPDDGGRLDLTPDPAEDPEAAEDFGPINDGLVERIELNRMVLRVEENTLNLALPPIEIQVADAKDADARDRRQWRTVGRVGEPGQATCGTSAAPAPPISFGAGEVKDLELVYERGGESFLNNQLADEGCVADGSSEAAGCKELSIRARSRLAFDTVRQPDRPRGIAKIRVILVATFFLNPF